MTIALRPPRGVIAAALLAVIAMSSCQEQPVPGAAPEDDSPAAIPAASARRPMRRYFLGRTAERCSIYTVDGDRKAEGPVIPCPPDLAVGERIRVAGRACMREGVSDPAREIPVVCPDPLTNFEKDERGELPR